MLILLAEDDPMISKLLLRLLAKDGYQVDHATDGEEVLLYVASNEYDLIIMDWMMPNMDGLTAVKNLRRQGYQGGIIMLTAKDGLASKVHGFEAGVDDYLVKPFEYEELHMRLLALMRRSQKKLIEETTTIGHFKLNRTQQLVWLDEQALDLTNREYQLLLVLLENAGQVLTRSRLIDLVWGMDSEVSDNNLDAYIRLLRKKIDQTGYKPIKNIRGVGYRMEA